MLYNVFLAYLNYSRIYLIGAPLFNTLSTLSLHTQSGSMEIRISINYIFYQWVVRGIDHFNLFLAGPTKRNRVRYQGL